MTAARKELAALRRLAALYRLQTHFTDALKRRVDAKPESLLAVLRAMGAPLDGIGGCMHALRQHHDESWNWHIEPVIVAWNGALDAIELRLPSTATGGVVDITVMLEDGGTLETRIDAAGAPIISTSESAGHQFVALGLQLQMRLPHGYHDLTLRAAGHELRSLVISAPLEAYTAPDGRHWGVFLPLYALYSRRSWGIGDFTDLEALVEWARGQGAHFVGTLPLLASFLDDEPFAPSPYQPVSRLFWNEIFIDLDAVVTALAGELAEDTTVPAATAKAARRLNARETVPYREVMALKRRALTELTRRKDQGPAANEAATPPPARPAPEDYAAFRAALQSLGPRWREWPSPQRSGTLSATDYDAATAGYYAFAQSLAQQQMARLERVARERGMRLYLDLPVGVHPDGYDAWRFQHVFVDRMSAGAPPDLFAPRGQNWGFQPVNPLAMRRDGYQYMRAYLRHHMLTGGLLRIDHAIGLHRLFWIPEGGTGHDGVFVRQPSEELYAIISLESHRAESVVVGENLGLVPREIDEGMARHGIGHMYVQSFALTGDAARPLRSPPRESIASFGTHDLAPFAAFWTGADLEQRVNLGIMKPAVARKLARERIKEKRALATHLRHRGLLDDPESVPDAYRGTTRLLAESRARWTMINLEDAWGDPRPQNVPGTTETQHANWVRRAKYGLEQFGESDDITSVTALMRSIRGNGKEAPNDRKE